MDKRIRKYTELYRKALIKKQLADTEGKSASYEKRLREMYESEAYKNHNVYPTMNVDLIYAVIAMCLELKGFGFSNQEIMDFSDIVFEKRKKFFTVLEKAVGVLPGTYKIAEKWNIDDHEKRVRDGSITYDSFDVQDGRIEYRISGCRYVDMFEYYGIRPLCRIFCKTDTAAYSQLTRSVKFTRYSDLSDGDSCHDVIERIGK